MSTSKLCTVVVPRGSCWSGLSLNEASPVGLLFWCLQQWKNTDRCFLWPALFLLSSRERNDKLNWLMHLTAPDAHSQDAHRSNSTHERLSNSFSQICVRKHGHKTFWLIHTSLQTPTLYVNAQENQLCVYGHAGPQGKRP